MLYRLFFRDTVVAGKLLVAYVGSVVFEVIDFGQVPFQEDFQVSEVDKTGAVRNDAGKEAFILFISPELPFPVVFSGDIDRFQLQAVTQDIHLGTESKLPTGILHGGRDDDFKAQVHPAMPFSHIPETGGDDGGVNHVVRYHFAGGFVFHGLHNEHFLSGIVLDRYGVAMGNRDDLALLLDFVTGQGEGGCQFFLANRLDLPHGPASREERDGHRHGG